VVEMNKPPGSVALRQQKEEKRNRQRNQHSSRPGIAISDQNAHAQDLLNINILIPTFVLDI
jgi:hypothetical protein